MAKVLATLRNERLEYILKEYKGTCIIFKMLDESIDGPWRPFYYGDSKYSNREYAGCKLEKRLRQNHLSCTLNDAVFYVSDKVYLVFMRAKPNSKRYKYLVNTEHFKEVKLTDRDDYIDLVKGENAAE